MVRECFFNDAFATRAWEGNVAGVNPVSWLRIPKREANTQSPFIDSVKEPLMSRVEAKKF
jgi:hypothetical protein